MFKLALSTVAVAVVVAGCGFNQSPAEHVDDALADVAANAPQKATIKKATDSFFKLATEKREVRKAARDVILVELAKDEPDAGVVEEQATKAAQSLTATAHALVDAGAVVHDTLTKEQRAKLTERMKPGRPARAAMFMAGRFGYGPPTDAALMRERADKRIDAALERINADDAQKKALKPIALSLVDEAAPLLESHRTSAEALLAAWNADEKIDAAKLNALIDDAKLEALAAKAAADLVEAHAILKPEQRRQILERAKEAGNRRGGPWGDR